MQIPRGLSVRARLLAWGAVCAVLGACADSVGPAPVGDAAAPGPDAAACRPGTPALFGVDGPACAAQPELAAPANASAGTFGTAYTLRGVRADADQRSNAALCAERPWMCGDDARVGFTAPEGGRWRVTASGAQLRTLSAARGCASSSSDDSLGLAFGADYRGPFVATGPLTVDIVAQRGERVELVMDGCPRGTGCTYDVRAERIGALTCDVRGTTTRICAQGGQHCVLDPCDSRGRFQCAPDHAPEWEYARVLRVDGAAVPYLVGRLRDDPDAVGNYVFWIPLDGSDAPIGAPAPHGGAPVAFGTEVAIPLGNLGADAVRVRLDFGLGAQPVGTRTLPIEPLARRAAGEACDEASFVARCADGLRCVPAAPGAGPTCVASTTLDITALTARYDAAGGVMVLDVGGFGTGARVWRADVELLDASGATIGREPTASVSGPLEQGPAAFRGSVMLDPWTAPAGLARVRVRVTDTGYVTSAPVEAAVEPATVVGLGERCSVEQRGAVACAAGLSCNVFTERCEPAPPARPCGMLPWSPTWAPPAQAGTYAIDGRTDRSRILECLVTRSASDAPIEFVAPVRGAYTFTMTADGGVSRRALQAACGAEVTCQEATPEQPRAQLDLMLEAGQRVPLTAGTADYQSGVHLEVRVPAPG